MCFLNAGKIIRYIDYIFYTSLAIFFFLKNLYSSYRSALFLFVINVGLCLCDYSECILRCNLLLFNL